MTRAAGHVHPRRRGLHRRRRRAARARPRRGGSSRSSPSATCAARSSWSASSPRRTREIVKEIAAGGHEVAPAQLPPRAAHRSRPRHVPARDRRRPRVHGRPRRARRARVPRTDVLARRVDACGPPTCSPRSASRTRRACSRRAARSTATRAGRAPRTAGRRACVELPCPVADVGPGHQSLPRRHLLPRAAVDRPCATASRTRSPTRCCGRTATRTTSIPGEPFQKRPDLGPWKSRLQWINRRRMFDRVDRLFAIERAPRRRWASASTRSRCVS